MTVSNDDKSIITHYLMYAVIKNNSIEYMIVVCGLKLMQSPGVKQSTCTVLHVSRYFARVIFVCIYLNCSHTCMSCTFLKYIYFLIDLE